MYKRELEECKREIVQMRDEHEAQIAQKDMEYLKMDEIREKEILKVRDQVKRYKQVVEAMKQERQGLLDREQSYLQIIEQLKAITITEQQPKASNLQAKKPSAQVSTQFTPRE